MQNQFMQDYAKSRTEDQIVAQTPIPIRLGGTEYSVKPLPIIKGREWRGKVSDVLNELATGPLGQTGINPTSLMQGVMVAFFSFPDRVLELTYAYSPELELKKDEIEGHATDEELVIAFSRIMAVAYPFFSLLGSMRSAAAAADQATHRQ